MRFKMKRKILFFPLFLMVFLLNGCQTYPSKPSKPSYFDRYVDVNVNPKIPTELNGISYNLVELKSTEKEVLRNE